MAYGLSCWHLGRSNFLPLTEQEVQSIVQANKTRLSALRIEENFEILLGNYYEFELECAREMLNSMVYFEYSHDYFQDARILFDRRIMNIMTSTRSYIDQFKSLVTEAMDDGGAAANAAKLMSSQIYDRSLSYRIMEALRNYVQHKGLPVHGMIYKNKWEDLDGERGMRHRLEILIENEVLKNDGKFKASVLKEMEAKDDKWSLRKAIPEYIDGIGELHDHIRDALSARVNDADELIDRRIKEYKDATPGDDALGLAVVDVHENGTRDKVCFVNDFAKNRRLGLLKKNKFVKNISKRYMTSR